MKTILTFAILLICACIPCRGEESLYPELAAKCDSIIRMLDIDTGNRYAICLQFDKYIVIVENLDMSRYDVYYNLIDKYNNFHEEKKKDSARFPNVFINHILDLADYVNPIEYEPRKEDVIYYMQSYDPKTDRTLEWSSEYGIKDFPYIMYYTTALQFTSIQSQLDNGDEISPLDDPLKFVEIAARYFQIKSFDGPAVKVY